MWIGHVATPAAGARMTSLDSRGARLTLFERGAGRPVVLVHGWSMSSRFFFRQLASDLPGCRVIAVDMRGHGDSEKPENGHTMAGYAADLRTVVEQHDLRDAVVLGWSMGAFVAWEYIRRYGCDNLGGLVVVDSPASDLRADDRPYGVTVERLGEMIRQMQTDRLAFVDTFLPRMFARPLSEEERAWMREEALAPPTSVACSLLAEQTAQDYSPVLGSVDVPALVCMGGDEQFYPVSCGEALVASMPNAQLEVFERSSHCPFLEEPTKFNAVLLDFVLNRVGAAPATPGTTQQ